METKGRSLTPPFILVLCSNNSCLSQMAEGWIRYYAGDAAKIYSAGIEARGVNPYAVRSMMEAVIDISAYKSKTVEELPVNQFDYLITLSEKAKEECPLLLPDAVLIHHSFTDLSDIKGSEEEIMRAVNTLRDELEDFAFDFIHHNIRSLIPSDLESIL